MQPSRIKYFRIDSKTKREYLAADSRDSVIRFISNFQDPVTLNIEYGYDLDTLVEIEEKDASLAPQFHAFKKKTALTDGIFYLGVIPK